MPRSGFVLFFARRKTRVIGLLLLGSVFGIAATRPGKEEFVNLKVLPANISSAALEKIMSEDFQEGLGVSCVYCHVQDAASRKFDYASDVKPEKDTARSMMRMTMQINRQFFHQQKTIGDSTAMVSCATCHHGNAVPK